MSLHRYTDYALSCDECGEMSAWASELVVSDPSSADLRRRLGQQGWRRERTEAEEGWVIYRDMCPKHPVRL